MKAFLPEVSICDKTVQRELKLYSEQGPVLLVFLNTINLGNRPSEEKLEKAKTLIKSTVEAISGCSELYICNPSGCFRPQTGELIKRIKGYYEVEVRFLIAPKNDDIKSFEKTHEINLGL